MFHEVQRRRNILLCLGKMFYKYIRSLWFEMSVESSSSLFSFCLDDLSIGQSLVSQLDESGESGVLKSSSITDILAVVVFFFMNMGTIVFSA